MSIVKPAAFPRDLNGLSSFASVCGWPELPKVMKMGLIKPLSDSSFSCSAKTLSSGTGPIDKVPCYKVQYLSWAVSFKMALSSALKATIALLIIVVVVTVVVVVVVTVVVVVVVVTVVVVVVVVSRPYPTVLGQMANPIAVTTPRWTRTLMNDNLHLVP
ncbi:hypothetical protein Tco_0010105 [Tanacetum coccineum]